MYSHYNTVATHLGIALLNFRYLEHFLMVFLQNDVSKAAIALELFMGAKLKIKYLNTATRAQHLRAQSILDWPCFAY